MANTEPEPAPGSVTSRAVAHSLGFAGALIGAGVGYWAVGLLARQGFYAIVLPAALPGILAGLLSKERSSLWAILYAVIGVAAALFTEWRFRPFIADASLSYFVRHLDRLQSSVLIAIAIGAILGGMFSLRSGRTSRNSPKD